MLNSRKDSPMQPRPLSVSVTSHVVRGRRILTFAPSAHQVESVPAVFLHGWGLSPTTFRALLVEVAKDRQVYSVALLPIDFADSKTLSYKIIAGDLQVVLNQLGLDRFHLVGHSVGACIAAQLSSRLLGRVVSLALFSPPWVPRPNNCLLPLTRTWGVGRQFFRPGQVVNGLRLIRDFIEQAVTRPKQLAMLLKLVLTQATKPIYAALQLPTKVVWAERDDLFSFRHSDEMKQIIPGVDLISLKAGHEWPLSHPTFGATVLRDFWASGSRTAS